MCTRKTSLSLLLFFVSIIYFTIRKVNPLCEKMYYSPVAVRKTMPHGPVMYITMKKAVARCSWFVARKSLTLYSDRLWSHLATGRTRLSL